jgi:hypothetical protein
MAARFAAEYAEFMLQRYDLVGVRVQEVGGALVVSQLGIVDLEANAWRISVIATMQVSVAGDDFATACCRSVVNVAIPQRRGSELPINASLSGNVTLSIGSGSASARQIRCLVQARH